MRQILDAEEAVLKFHESIITVPRRPRLSKQKISKQNFTSGPRTRSLPNSRNQNIAKESQASSLRNERRTSYRKSQSCRRFCFRQRSFEHVNRHNIRILIGLIERLVDPSIRLFLGGDVGCGLIWSINEDFRVAETGGIVLLRV